MKKKTTRYFSLLTKHSLALLALSLVLIPTFMSAQTVGTLDPTFGTGGKVTTDFGGSSAARIVPVQANGQTLAAGVAVPNGITGFALARYNSDGTLDASFGTGGIVTTAFDFPGSFDRVFTVVRQPDGKFLSGGSTVVNLFANFAVIVTNVGTTPVTFTSISIAGTNLGDYQISANTCGTSLAARGSCTVSVRFKPTAAPTRKGTLRVADNGGGSPQTASLSGVGQ